MARDHQITINGTRFTAHSGELLLDAALASGIELPHDCRAGHCGTCCVRLVAGKVRGGEGAQPGIVHACQCRIIEDAEFERSRASDVRTIDGVLGALRPVSHEVIEVAIRTKRALPHHAGQYAQVQFDGFPSRPFSITLPLRGNSSIRTIWLHVRRVGDGLVTSALGTRIKPGHRVRLTGPHGSAHFRRDMESRLVLVATSTGFAPIWSIAVAALRENPERPMVIIAGARTIEGLYMGPALVRLSRLPHVRVLPVCSTPQSVSKAVLPGRPTEHLPQLAPSDVVYVCGAPGMVESVKAIAARAGAICYADPFLPAGDGGLSRAPRHRMAAPSLRRPAELAAERRRGQAFEAQRLAEAG